MGPVVSRRSLLAGAAGAAVRRERDALTVTVELLWQGTALSVTAQLEG